MKKQILYGMLGFLSLLGFAGVFTEARGFLGFFAFAVDFQYFFLKSDEMLGSAAGPVRLPGVCGRDADDGGRCAGDPDAGRFYPPAGTPYRLHGWLGCLCGGLRPDRRLVRLPGELGAGAVIRNRMKEHRARLGRSRRSWQSWWGSGGRPSETWKRGGTTPLWCWPGTSPRCSGCPLKKYLP